MITLSAHSAATRCLGDVCRASTRWWDERGYRCGRRLAGWPCREGPGPARGVVVYSRESAWMRNSRQVIDPARHSPLLAGCSP
jgi:hypothetical protein